MASLILLLIFSSLLYLKIIKGDLKGSPPLTFELWSEDDFFERDCSFFDSSEIFLEVVGPFEPPLSFDLLTTTL
jgi:hypothetical protein